MVNLSRKISIGDNEIKFVDNSSSDDMASIREATCDYCNKYKPCFKDFCSMTYAGDICQDCLTVAFSMHNELNEFLVKMEKKGNTMESK